MKKKFFCVTCVAVCCSMFMVAQANWDGSRVQNLTMTDVEALSACESVGWKNNDGNCVHNSAGVYFCKEDSWCEITDCKQ